MRKSNFYGKLFMAVMLIGTFVMSVALVAIRRARIISDFERLFKAMINYVTSDTWPLSKILWVGSFALVALFVVVYGLIKLFKKQFPYMSFFAAFAYVGIAGSWRYRHKIIHYYELVQHPENLSTPKLIAFYVFIGAVAIVAISLLVSIVIAIIKDIINFSIDKKVEKIEIKQVESKGQTPSPVVVPHEEKPQEEKPQEEKPVDEDPRVRIIRLAKIEIDNADSIEKIDEIVAQAKRDLDALLVKPVVAPVEVEPVVVPVEEEPVVIPVVETPVEAPVEEEPVVTPVEEEPVETPVEAPVEAPVVENAFFAAIKGKGNMAKAFDYKMHVATERTKVWYSGIKNELLSYRKVRSRTSRACNSFRIGRNLLVKITLVGKTMKVYFALNCDEFDVNRFHQKDVSATRKYVDVPFMVKIKSNRSYKNAILLIGELMAKHQVEKNPRFTSVDYVSLYNPLSQNLLKSMGLAGLVVDRINVEEANAALSDSQAEDLIQKVEDDTPVDVKHESIINIDDISKAFASGEEVNLESLKNVMNITRKTDRVVIAAQGVVDKPLNVHANEFSLSAVKMIVLAGGNVVLHAPKK